MQVRWYQSLKFKLFMLMGIFLLLVAGAVSGKNIYDFQKILKDQLSERLLGVAKTSLASLENHIQTWRSQMHHSLRVAALNKPNLVRETVKSLVESDGQIVSFHLMSVDAERRIKTMAYAFTGGTSAADFMGKNPKTIKKRLFKGEVKWIKKHKGLRGKSIFFENPTKSIGIPVIRIWIPAITGKKSLNWAVLTVLQQGVAKVLANSRDTWSALLDHKGRVLISPKLSDVRNRKNFSHLAVVRQAVLGKAMIGSQEFTGADGKAMIGTFAFSKKLGATLFVQRDPHLAYNEIKRQIANTALLSLVFLLLALLASYHAANGITKSLHELVAGTQKIAFGDFNSQMNPKTKDEVAFVSHAVNFMAGKIQHLMVSQVEAARQEKELETAKTVQETLLPREDRVVGPISITGAYYPASECGGDWWGNFTAANGMEFVCIADATGHGAAAALVTAMAFSSCMTMAKMQSEMGHNDGPDEILARLNKIMCSAGSGNITMTFFAAFINPQTGEMIYSNAGHNFPFLIPLRRDDQRLRKLRKKKKGGRALPLLLGGVPLGFHEDSTYKTKKIQLQPGDKLFLFTDGLIECTNRDKVMWGRNNLLSTISDVCEKSHVDLKNTSVERAFKFFDGHPMDDDVTVVVVEMARDWIPQSHTEEVA